MERNMAGGRRHWLIQTVSFACLVLCGGTVEEGRAVLLGLGAQVPLSDGQQEDWIRCHDGRRDPGGLPLSSEIAYCNRG